MIEKIQISDPFGILAGLNPDAPKMVDAHPDIGQALARIEDHVAKAEYLEPYFFHPNPAVQARAAKACVPVDVSMLGDYLTNVLATAKEPDTISAAASAVWQREEAGTGGVFYAVDSLRAYLHLLGRTKVRQIADALIKHAPNDEARAKFSEEASSGGVNLLEI